MSINNGLFSSESVSEGHPDKVADRISDRILDTFLERDPNARVACETLLADQLVVVAGEFKTKRAEDFQAVKETAETLVRQVLRDTGYRDSSTGIDPDRCEVQIRFNGQSEDINRGVDRSDGVLGAGDQGLMFGYACDETPELMPAPIIYAHRLVRRQAEVRKNATLPWLQPDAKSQVTFRYVDGRPTEIEAVVLSTQHDHEIELGDPSRGGEAYNRYNHSPRAAVFDISNLDQPDWALRHGWPQRGCWPDWTQDYSGYLRRSSTARWRRLLWQRSL